MWAGSNAVGLIGLVLNVYMCMTWSDHTSYLLLLSLLICMYHSYSYYPLDHFCLVWLCRYLGGKKVFLAVPYQVKACVFVGLLYSIVGTLPSLIMKYDLPCSECNTEEWWCKIIFPLRILLLFVTRVLFSTWCLSTGKGPLCAINRSSIFFLLSLQIHLCDLVRSLYVDITVENQRRSQGLIWKVLSVGIPCLLMAISYGGVCLSSYVNVMSRLWFSLLITNACHQWNVARTVRQARTINSM